MAFAAIDAANSFDPRSVIVDGVSQPANLIYGLRMSAELERFAPDAAEELQIAARGQHIERWFIPRGRYPMERQRYHRWRLALRDHYAARLSAILADLSYNHVAIARVASIVRKERPKEDDEVQTLEDVICIVFVKYELEAFAGKYADADTRLADILAKTWRKMSAADSRPCYRFLLRQASCRCSIKVLSGCSLQIPNVLSKRSILEWISAPGT